MSRIIAHLDMDAFFAAVEERDNERFRNRAIVIGADPMGGRGRGVVSTANYKARVYGIHSAMPISLAWERAQCAPKKYPVLFLGVDMEKYEQESSRIRNIISSYSLPIEQVSIDEFFIDCSVLDSYIIAKREMLGIQKNIKRECSLSCSVGIGPNKLIAKIASDFKKPHGCTTVSEDQLEVFLRDLSVSKIPGIGPKSNLTLSHLGIQTVGDLQKRSLKELEDIFGKNGAHIFQSVRGIHNDPVCESGDVQSVSAQETFMRDTHDVLIAYSSMKRLVLDAYTRLIEYHFFSCSRISITVRFSNFETMQRSKTSEKPLSKIEDIEFMALQMLAPFFDSRENKKRRAVRLLGVRLEKLSKQKNFL